MKISDLNEFGVKRICLETAGIFYVLFIYEYEFINWRDLSAFININLSSYTVRKHLK